MACYSVMLSREFFVRHQQFAEIEVVADSEAEACRKANRCMQSVP